MVGGAETGAKLVRAMPVASQANAGNLSVLRGGWNRAFVEELAAFPAGRCDDQVDALSRAFGMLQGGGEPARVARVNWAQR